MRRKPLKHSGVSKAVIMATALLLCVLHPEATAAEKSLFDSPAFDDPTLTQQMDRAWIDRPVRHPPDHGQYDLHVILSYQMSATWQAWLEEYAAEKGIRIHFEDGADGTAAGALRRKDADITCFCGSPTQTDRLPGVRFHTVGITPVVFYTHPENSLRGISLQDAMEIFRGETTNWADLGTAPKHIVPVARSHCKKRLGRWRPLNNMEHLSPTAIKVGSIDDAIDYVAATPGAIGYEILPRLSSANKQGRIKILRLNGIDPYHLGALRSNDYPMYRVYTFTSWSGGQLENHLANQVIDHLQRKTAEEATSIHFVPATELRTHGWKFDGDELVGEP